jgi:hypothetical protein
MASPLSNELNFLDHDVETTWNVSDPLKEAIDDQYKAYASLMNRRAENVKPSVNVYGPPMHRNPRSTIRPSFRMIKLFKIVSEIAPQVQAGEQFQTILSIFDAANALKLLHRFIDRKQAIMKKQFQVDGDEETIMSYAVNPAQHRQFDHELRLQKIFVRLLHVKGLTSYVGSGSPMNQAYLYSLGWIYKIARLLLEEEVSRITPNLDTDSYDAHEGYGDPAASLFAVCIPSLYLVSLILQC